MIIFKKNSTPKLVYRTKPWKIALMVFIPITSVTVLGVGIYYIIDIVEKNSIKYCFSVNSLSSKYSNLEVPDLNDEIVKNILEAQFSANQMHSIDTSKTFDVKIIDGTSSAVNGVVRVSAYFTLTNGTTINNEFEITGFKPQARPGYLPELLSVAGTDLASVFPQELVLADTPNMFNEALPQYQTLKQFLFDNLPDKPADLLIDDFNIKVQDFANGENSDSSYSPWGGYFYVNYGLNEEIYKCPTFKRTVRLEGFKKYELAPLVPNADGVIMIKVPSEYKTQNAKNVGENVDLIKRIIVQYLRSAATDPDTIPLSPNDIKIEINRVDNDNGQIFLRSLQITKYIPTQTYTNLCITGFYYQRPKLSSDRIDVATSFPEYANFTAKEIDNQKLQDIVKRSLIIPPNLNISSGDIVVNVTNINNFIGSIQADVSIPKFVVEPFNKRVTFTNFKITRPEPLNGVDTPYTVPPQFANFKPSDLQDGSLKRMVFFYMSKSIGGELSANDINIIDKKPNDVEHSIIIKGNIPKYVQRDPYNFEIKVIGFK